MIWKEQTMVRLDLTGEETEVLIKIMENYLSELRMEIADTDQQDFREKLKNEKSVVLKTLEILQENITRVADV